MSTHHTPPVDLVTALDAWRSYFSNQIGATQLGLLTAGMSIMDALDVILSDTTPRDTAHIGVPAQPIEPLIDEARASQDPEARRLAVIVDALADMLIDSEDGTPALDITLH